MPHPTPELSLLADGFRRVGPLPAALEARRLRERLALAASGATGATDAVKDGLATLGSWQNASAIAPLLPAGAFGRSPAGLRALRGVLRFLGTPPTAPEALDQVARGAPARVVGQVQKARWKLFSHIWSKGESSGHNVRLLVEEGHDFFLAVPCGPEVRVVLILASGGWLAGGPEIALDAGDQVEVLGLVDWLIEPGADLGLEARSSSRGPRGEPMVLALRAGPEMPLMVRKLVREDGREG